MKPGTYSADPADHHPVTCRKAHPGRSHTDWLMHESDATAAAESAARRAEWRRLIDEAERHEAEGDES